MRSQDLKINCEVSDTMIITDLISTLQIHVTTSVEWMLQERFGHGLFYLCPILLLFFFSSIYLYRLLAQHHSYQKHASYYRDLELDW